MTPPSRYEIIDTIAAGEFATVFRGRDRELGREVAIKQIHEHYLADPAQLERYWGEAQLLASLQHPNIVTIYDLVRSKGWIILELMRGSLKRGPQSKPIDLDLLRMVLRCSLGALEFLHGNGVIHGDIKPSNMLVDMQNRVKLGDFGLARRATSAEGSLLKGATKYMAPELMSADFGEVGPASDLYSLGFSAYELMCGAQFIELFPGLGSYGRNEQVAWMMWHSAPDRRLPEIRRVLEGVPEDLARVIERLAKKDQRERYRSAAEALGDLEVGPARRDRPADAPAAAGRAARAAAARKKGLRRSGLGAAAVCSIVLSILMLLPPAEPQGTDLPEPVEGVVRQPFRPGEDFEIELPDGVPKVIKFRGETRTFLNDRAALPTELREGDQIVVRVLRSDTGGLVTELRATRPETGRGAITAITLADRSIELSLDGDPGGRTLRVVVPEDLAIRFNGQAVREGEPVKLADLAAGDRVSVRHVGSPAGPRRATELSILRVVRSEGIFRGLDASRGVITVALGEADDAPLARWPLAEDCQVTLNGRRVLDQRALAPGDLKPGDRVKVAHDDKVVGIDAYRTVGTSGTLTRIDYQQGRIEVQREGASGPAAYRVDAQTAITLGGQPASLGDLRKDDVLEIAHDQLEAEEPTAASIAASRPGDPRRFALLIAVGDAPASGPGAAADAQLLREKLLARYRVPEDQAVLVTDADRAALEQAAAALLDRARADSQVIVYLAGRATRDAEGRVFLTTRGFDPDRPAGTGVALQEVVDRLEACPAGDKILVLDFGPAPGTDPADAPTGEEMFRSLAARPNRGPLRTITGLAGCAAGEHNAVDPARGHGLFALCLAEGFAGSADRDRDGRLKPTELLTHLQTALREAGAAQTPSLVVADPRPPRLSDEAIAAIRELAGHVDRAGFDMAAAKADYEKSANLAGKEVEPALLWGLIQMNQRESQAAMEQWETIKAQHPDLLLPREAIAWLRLEKNRGPLDPAVADLVELVSHLPKPNGPDDPAGPTSLRIARWCGRIREYATLAAQEHRRPAAASVARLDAAAAAQGVEILSEYEKGRQESRDVWQQYAARIDQATDRWDKTLLGKEQELVSGGSRAKLPYARFPYREAVQEILAGLDR